MRHLKSVDRPAKKNLLVAFLLFLCALAFLIAPSLPTVMGEPNSPNTVPVIAPGSAYRQTNLVSDSPGVGTIEDPLLVNPWGISMGATSPFWVANAGTSTSTLYRETSTTPLVKNPAMPHITIPGGLPTGTVANPTATDFVLPGACASAPCGANFLFASITGNITGWDPNAPAAGSTTAVIAVSRSGSVYTGLAIGNNGGGNFLYAADSKNNNIDVFNSSFALQSEASFPFTDPTVGPQALPADYHVHNIQALGGELYVTYAKINPAPPNPADPYIRPGGAVNVFDFNGNFLRRVVLNGPLGAPLSAPWGVAIAPATFGIFGDALLVGNFDFDGNGRISAYNKTTGAFLGQVQDESGLLVNIDGLWGLQFGNGGNGGNPNSLYFSAGLAHEQHGLFGKLDPTTSTATSLIQFSADDYAINESSGSIEITVTRSGDASGTATVNYATFDEGGEGHASQTSDYEIALGKVTFEPGETSKTFDVLLVDDGFIETNEIVNLILSNPTGAGAGLGSPNVAELTIGDNDMPSTSNPIDDPQFFVRQHYLDFLHREPDPNGFAFWTNEITSCGTDAQCTEVKRINVSAAFFLSIEFQDSGFAAYLTHRAAFGATVHDVPTPVLYGQFMRDLQAINRDVIFGIPGSAERLEENKVAYYNDFVTRPEFVTKYPSTQTNEQYVDALLASANLTPSEVRLFDVNMTNAQENPPANPTASPSGPRPASFGTARLQFNSAQTAMTLTSTVQNIDFTGSQSPDVNDNLTNAHIHASATVTPMTNAPVVWGFIGAPFNDNNPNDAVVTPFTSGVGGSARGKWDAPEGNSTTLAAQLSNLREGRAYVNFHTRQFGGGEIRGNIPAADAFRNSLVAGLNGGTETRATVLRKVSEQAELKVREFNAAFVAMEYFGYLRRDADAAGYNFWLNKLNSFNGDFRASEMVKAFISSIEYRQRFGPN
jgi:uncharacterized protein (TIGR03118 family)